MRTATLNKAKNILHNRRANAQAKADMTLHQLNNNTKWSQLEHDIRLQDMALYKARIKGEDLTLLLAHREELYQHRSLLLSQLGIQPHQLIPQYTCSTCQDTGYVQGNICKCLATIIRQLTVGEGSINMPNVTFSNSKHSNQHNQKVYSSCQLLCQKIDSTHFANVLLTGKTGTGKTYLLACMANMLMDMGKEVLMMSAHKLNQQLLHMHLGDTATRTEYLDSICDVDILVIDDLGTENKYNNVTKEYLYSIVNERLLNAKHTFISTNLSLADIQERYGDRIFSRLANSDITLIAQLLGKDQRTQH